MKTIQKLALLLCVFPGLLLATEKTSADKALPIKEINQQEATQANPQADKKADSLTPAPEAKEATEAKKPTVVKSAPVKQTEKKPLSKQPNVENTKKADSTQKDMSEEQALAELEKIFKQMEAEEAQKKAAAQATDKNSKKETNKAALANVAAKKADAANKPAQKQVELT